jgi:cold shock CspA family protein
VSEYFYGAARKAAPRRKPMMSRPPERRGVSTAGKIVKLLVGQGHGFIRLSDGREIFFHRSDVRDGTSFNDFAVGDVVSFELLEDDVSGARALRVRRKRPQR